MPGGFGPRFLLEALFLVLVAVVAGLADLPARGIILVMAAAWLLTAAVEWAASRERARVALEERETTDPPVAPARKTRERRWLRRKAAEPVVGPPKHVASAPHVRLLPQEPDPAAQPVLERAAPEPAALVEASAAPERPPPPPEPKRKPTPAVRAEPPPVERAVSEPPKAEGDEEPTRAEPAPVLAVAPSPEPKAEAEPERAPEPEPVTALPLSSRPREWNLWDLERLTRERGSTDVIRTEEWEYLLMYLREFASPDGLLPADFDGLVRESFGELLATSSRT